MHRLGLLLVIIAKVSCTVPTTGINERHHHDLGSTEPGPQSSPAVPVMSREALQKLLQNYFPTATLSSVGDGYGTAEDEQEVETPAYQPPQQPIAALPPGGFPRPTQGAGVTPQAYLPDQDSQQRAYHRSVENNQTPESEVPQAVRRPVQGTAQQYGQRGLQGLDKQTILQSLHRIYQNQAQEKGFQNQRPQESVAGARFMPDVPQQFNPRVFAHQRPQLEGYPRVADSAPATGHPGQTARAPSPNSGTNE